MVLACSSAIYRKAYETIQQPAVDKYRQNLSISSGISKTTKQMQT